VLIRLCILDISDRRALLLLPAWKFLQTPWNFILTGTDGVWLDFGYDAGLEGRIEPGRVFDRSVALEEVPDGYRAMNEREALKVLIRPS
jgi:hypothetical protein